MKYARHSETSFQAAVDNLPRAGTQKARILTYLETVGDATRDEMEADLDLSGNAVRPRIVELIEAGLVEETERTRVTRSGSKATVLVACSSGVHTEGRDQAEKSIPQPVDATLSVDSGVEALALSSPPPPPGEGAKGSSRSSAYDPFEDWAA